MQTIFAIAQSDLILQLLAGLGVILLAMILSTHGHRLRPFIDIKYALPAVLVALSPLAIIALVEIFQIVLNGVEGFGEDKRGYTILLAALAGAPFVIWRTWIAQKQGVVAEQGHMTDRISKAVEQLGAEKTVWIEGEQSTEPNLEVRIGAIYALERIAQDSMRDHIWVMEILCAYIRSNASKSDLSYVKNHKTPREDIKSALNVIGRRSEQQIDFERSLSLNKFTSRYRLDLSKVHIIGADLQGLNFDHAKFSFSNISHAALRRTTFRGALLLKTSFANSYFASANFELALVFNADFSNADEITFEQIEDMFGNKTTKIPELISSPSWIHWELNSADSNDIWISRKKEAGLF